MISRIAGQLLSRNPPQLLIDVHGIGYDVEVPMSTFYQLPAVGETVILLTHLQVRDDAHLLYGFATAAERVLFRALLKVNGVGARVALAVLSGMEAEHFQQSIASKDVAALMRIPGIGKKTAERLILEMPDQLPKADAAAPTAGLTETAVVDPLPVDPEAQAVAALVTLGFKPAEASRFIKRTEVDKTAPVEEWIRSALKLATTA